MLPKPEFYVLYNGTKSYPPKGILKLSDAFIGIEAGEQPGMELIVNVININYEAKSELLNKNEDIRGYALFVEKVRKNQALGMSLAEAIKTAVEECLAEGILTEFLLKHRNEVESMFSLVYEEEKAMQFAREEAWEDGREEGFELSAAIIRAYKEKVPAEEIAAMYRLPVAKVNQIIAALAL